jgi:5'-phosphate synthase pdxT subunit
LNVDGVDGGPVHAIFIRAPWIEHYGPEVTVLAKVDGHPVAIRQGNMVALSFHPELTGEDRLHRFFLGLLS